MPWIYLMTYEEAEYWITAYQCTPWEASSEENCDLCNNDVRTCSYYRCKSLGDTCQYYTANGEPGYCA